MPDTAMLVGDTQYRGEPINPVSSGVNYLDLRPVGIAPPPAVAAPVDKQKPALPSWQDYLAQQQAAFVPQTNAGWNPFNTQGQEQFTQFDKNAALKNFVEQGGKINYQDFLSSLPKDPGYGDVFSRALQGLGGASSAAQQWLSAYSPEFQKIGEFDPKNNPGGYLVSEIGNQPTLTRRRSDIGDNWVEYRPINSDGSLGKPKVEYQPKSGGLGSFLKTVAPLALGAFAPGIGNLLGGGLMGQIGAGAILGGGTSALTGGNILKGAALGGLGAGVSSGIGSLTAGMDPSIASALQGAAPAVVRGAVTGNFDPASILAGAATGYLRDPITSAIKENVPSSGYETVDNIIRNTAINAPGTLIRGGDLGNLLENTAIGELTKTATGYIPKTGTDFIDKIIGGTATQYATNELKDLIGASPSRAPAPAPVAAAPTPAPVAAAPAPAPVAAAPAPAAQDNSGLVAALLAMGLMDTGGQSPVVQQAAAPAPMPAFDVNSMFLSNYLGNKNRQPQTVAELLQSLRTA